MSIVLKIMKGLYRERFVQIATVILGVILISATSVYYFERARENSTIRSLWDGVWWSVVTMGTVGYGDIYPITAGGRAVGLLLIFAGVGKNKVFTRLDGKQRAVFGEIALFEELKRAASV